MRMRRWCSWVLSLSLLVAATAGVAAHDHAAEIEATGYDCSLEHAGDHELEAPSDAPGLEPAGEQHRHLCIGCHFSGKRLVTASGLVLGGFGRLEERSFDTLNPPLRSTAWSGRTLRGPPRAGLS